ncbi:MAG: GGDEF domain-containing protein [Gammaproteobacteria bacterium]
MTEPDQTNQQSLYQDDIQFRKDRGQIRQYLDKSRFWRTVVLLLVTLAPLTSFTLYYTAALSQVDQHFRNQVVATTRIVAAVVDTGKHEQLVAKGGNGSEYAELLGLLAGIRAQFPELRQLSTRLVRDNKLYVVLDTELANGANPVSQQSGILLKLHTPSPEESDGLRLVLETGLWYAKDMVFNGIKNYQGACISLPVSAASDPTLLCSVFSADSYRENINLLERDSLLAIFFTIIASIFLAFSVLKNHEQVTKSLHMAEKQRDMFLEYSRTDPLTGALNRRAFDSAYVIAEAQLRRNKLPFALITLDIDNFKLINDRYGHDQGDLVLRALVQNLQKVIRPSDILMRMGGEEFMILCNLADANQTWSMAEKLRETAARIHMTTSSGKLIQFTISLGIRIIGVGDDAGLSQKYADVALYYAKASGRNRTVIYTPGLEEKLQALLSARG